MEKYEGEKFRTIFLVKNPIKSSKSEQLIAWFRKLHNAGLAPEYGKGSSGNLSFRFKDGFIIKGTRTFFNAITEEDLVFVTKFDLREKIAYVYGNKIPSTELQMHYIIYKNRKNVNAVFHVHDYNAMKIAKKYNIPVTKVTESGTEKIGYDVVKCLDRKKFVVMKNHGVASVGKDIEEAGEIILKFHELASKG